jgi:hypothetical protein
VRPCSFTAASEATRIAAEASEIWLATAAVTLPPWVGGAPRALVDLDPGQRGDLALEVTVIDRRDRAAVALQGESFHVLARDLPSVGDHLGGAELGDLLVPIALLPAGRAAERVAEAELLAAGHRGRDRDRAHVLHAAGDDQVLGAAHHPLGGEVDRLLGGAALAVDGGAGDALGQPGGEPGGAGDVAGLRADRVDAAEDDVVDPLRIDPGALDQRLDRVGAEVGGVDPGEPAAAPPDRGAHRVDDVGLRHLLSPSR